MNAENTKNSAIHENADANITCDFGDGDISRFRSRLPATLLARFREQRMQIVTEIIINYPHESHPTPPTATHKDNLRAMLLNVVAGKVASVRLPHLSCDRMG